MTDNMNFDAAAYTALGTPRERVALPGSTFDGTVNVPVMHQAVKAFLANQRQGTHATKTRRWVVGGNQKPWKQKGTGRARQGSTRAPHFVGGGTVFGPQPHGYRETLTKQVRQLARKSALNARAREQALVVIDRCTYEKPKTSQIAQLVARVDAIGKKVLILTDGAKPAVYLSARNIPGVEVRPYADVTAYDVVWSDVVLVEASAIGHALAPVAETTAEPMKRTPSAKVPKTPKKAEKSAAAKKTAARSAAKKKEVKAAAKKSPAGKAAPKAAAKKAPAKGAAKAAPKKKGK
jgi:large subunit ribosomal protein L4